MTILSSKVKQHDLRCFVFVVHLIVWNRDLSRPNLNSMSLITF